MAVPAEVVLTTAARAGFPAPSHRVVTKVPSNLADVLPLIRVNCFGGQGEQVRTFTNPRVDFDCFAATYEAAAQLAYDLREWFVGTAAGQVYAGSALTRVDPGPEPISAPWSNASVERFVWTTQIRLHAQGVA